MRVNKKTISLLKQWGKLSNENRSEKISAFSFAFIDGREKKLKARLLSGQDVYNIDRDVFAGFVNEYFIFLSQYETLIKNLDSETAKIDSNRINFYPVTIVETEDGKRHFEYKNIGAVDIETVFKKIYQFIQSRQTIDISNLNKDDIPKEIEDSIKFFRQFINPKVKYLIVRTRMDITYMNNKNEIRSNQISWHVIGDDNSDCSETYKLMNEFRVLPFDIDLGRVEELKI